MLKRKQHASELKAKAALEALKGEASSERWSPNYFDLFKLSVLGFLLMR